MLNKAVRRVSVEVVLSSGTAQYSLGQFQRLSRAKLYQVNFPRNSNLTLAPSGKSIASDTTFYNAYLTLITHSDVKVIDAEPVYNYSPDATFKPVVPFPGNEIDFTKSFIQFPTAAAVQSGDNGKVIEVIFEYEEITP